MRIPESLVPQVRAVLQSVEVLSVTRQAGQAGPVAPSSMADIFEQFPVPVIQEGLRRAYKKGFLAGEESAVADSLEASGLSHMIQPVMDAFRVRSPNPPGPEFVQAFMKVRYDWYRLTGSRVNCDYFFPAVADSENG